MGTGQRRRHRRSGRQGHSKQAIQSRTDRVGHSDRPRDTTEEPGHGCASWLKIMLCLTQREILNRVIGLARVEARIWLMIIVQKNIKGM
jgi:hypothetical protein